MSGVQKGKDGKNPHGSEDSKWEEKGARPKEFKNLETKRKRKEKVPVVSPESKPVDEKVIPKSKKGVHFAESQRMDLTEARGKETKPQVPTSPFSKLKIGPEETRRRTVGIISPRKLWTDPDESKHTWSKPVDEKVSPKSNYGMLSGKDGKTPHGSEDAKWEGKGACPKEFKNLEKRKKQIPSEYVKGQSEAQNTERKSDNFVPQVLPHARKLFESSGDLKHTVESPESKPVDEKVSPKSKKGVYFAESQRMDLTEAKGKETKPQEPISTFSKLTIDPEDTHRKTDYLPGKLWEDPDRKRSKKKEIPTPTIPKLKIDPEETRTKADVISPRKLWTDPDSTRSKRK